MKLVEAIDATRTLAEYAAEIQASPVVVTEGGRPVAALVPIENADMETVSLSTNPKFLNLIARSRERARVEGSISSEDMRLRLTGQQR